ncbi:hypothetical protein ACQKDB_05510 [Planococcus kocurii]|uniref:hypothetical protein n=1 Tax=Planococcus kocurii TaxID=1374 RepID=UPI003CFE91DA
MKKNLFLFSSALMIAMLLAACGTAATVEEDTEPVEAPAEDTTASEDESVEESTEDNTASDDESVEESTEDTTTNDDGSVEESTEDTTTSDDESVEEAAGTLIQSDEQNYKLHVLDGYELTAEEPNKDSLYVSDNSAVFMRIETFSSEDIDFASATESMKQTLKAVNPDTEAVEASNFDGANFKQSAAFEVPSTEGSVTGIVYENDKLIVRLTIFDDNTVNATEDFISMGKTIQSVE